MSQTAICLETKNVYRLEDLLRQHPEDELIKKFSGKKFGCVQCMKERDKEKHGVSRPIEQILSEVDISQIPPEKHFRRSTSYTRNDQYIDSQCCFTHVPGAAVNTKCATSESRHDEYCTELAKGKRNLIPTLDIRIPNLFSVVMARYIKNPSFREPDIAFCIAESPELHKQLTGEVDRGELRVLDFDGYKGHLAVEVQMSPIKLDEFKQRTRDHLQHFQNVIWIFHKSFLGNVMAVRAYLEEKEIDAHVIVDKGGGFFKIELQAYKKRGKQDPQKRRDYCPQALKRKCKQVRRTEPEQEAVYKWALAHLKRGYKMEQLFNPRYWKDAESF